MASHIPSNTMQRQQDRPAGIAILIAATFLSIGLGNAWHPMVLHHTSGATAAYGIWIAILAVASLPVVFCSLYRRPMRRTLAMAFIPPVVVGTVFHVIWHHPFALLAAPISLWLMCLLTAVTSPDRRARLVANQGRCGKCGYDLTGNVSGACPECGDVVGPVRAGAPRWWAVLRTVLLWFAGVVAALVVFGAMFAKVISQPI